MPRSVFTYQETRSLSTLLDARMAARTERLAARYNSTRNRKMAIFANDHIGIQINQFGLYDRTGLDLLFHFLAPLSSLFREGMALDIGANIGNHALYFADRFRTVHCFEPNPATYYLLAFNAGLANNVVPHAWGLGDANGHAELHQNFSNMGASSLVHAASGDAPGVQVEIRRLDETDLDLQGLCFIKLDVEGFEANVLRGAVDTLARHQPVVVLEQHETEFVRGETPSILLLKELGYRFCWPQKQHGGKSLLARRLQAIRHLLLRRPYLHEIITAETVPRKTYSTLIAVPPRFQRELGLASEPRP